MEFQPTNEFELLQMLQHSSAAVRSAGWNTFFDWYQSLLYVDARRSLLKRGMTDNLDEDAVTIVRDMWLKLQDNIHNFEHRKERGLYHYARSYLAYEAWNLRRAKEREMRLEARHVSFEGAEQYGGELALNALLAVINTYHLRSDSLELDDEPVQYLEIMAQQLHDRMRPEEIELLKSRLVNAEDYRSLAQRLNISENYARQKIYRARQHLIATYKALVEEAHTDGMISYGTFRWLMSCTESV